MIKSIVSAVLLSLLATNVWCADDDNSIQKKKTITIPDNLEEQPKKSLMEAQFQRVPPMQDVFVPKGQWLFGGTISYSEHENDKYKFIIIEDWSGKGYNVRPTLFAGYAFANNTVAGFRLEYERSLLEINSLNLNLGDDLNFDIDNAYTLRQTVTASVFMRNYLSLFKSRRFGLFNDVQISVGGGRGKLTSGKGETLKGTYEEITKFNVGIMPGLAVFATDNVALEVSIGVLGFTSTWIKQVTNQVYEGTRNSNNGSFKINIFSIKIGLSFYFNNKRFVTNKYRGR
ncbi:MAG: hypothetical protein RR277_02970 [Rikenellaceae bacterium]